MTHIIGISAYYHDSAAALVSDGRIVAAAQEERFTRRKHDAAFPRNALEYCLQAGGITLHDVNHIVFYDKPLLKFERLLESYLANAPGGWRSFRKAMPVWLKEKLYLKRTLRRELCQLGGLQEEYLPRLLFGEHHQSHAASAFYPSPYQRAAVLCLDGVGEWATSSVWQGDGNCLQPLWEIHFPHSLGLLYSAFTYFCGFKVNSGEYKLMGLAPYGRPVYAEKIQTHLIDIRADGTFRLNMKYFDYVTGLRMTNRRFQRLFDAPPRNPQEPLRQLDLDLAASIQAVTEEVVLRLGQTIFRETGNQKLCLAGGVALNCVANGRLLREGRFDGIWIQPAAGDAGGALGAALLGWHGYLDQPRCRNGDDRDDMQGSFLGPCFSNGNVRECLESTHLQYRELPDEKLFEEAARLIEQEQVVGWFQGRMEFGPRALGARSILGDARSPGMQETMNLKIKFRESFRPFAPSVLAERCSDYFDLSADSPYMLLVADVHPALRNPTGDERAASGLLKLRQVRSRLPAITHVDYSARVQTVHADTNPRYHALLTAFEKQTGCPVIINTSFNVRGEPPVCSPADAIACFMQTEMDALIMENCLILKKDQPADILARDWSRKFEAD